MSLFVSQLLGTIPCTAEAIIEDAPIISQLLGWKWAHKVFPQLEGLIPDEHVGCSGFLGELPQSRDAQIFFLEGLAEVGVLEHPSIALAALCADINQDVFVGAVHNGHKHDGKCVLKKKRNEETSSSYSFQGCK